MDTVKQRAIVIVLALTILAIGTIAHSQSIKPKTGISNEQLIKQLQAQIEQLQVIIKAQEVEIQRLKALCKEAGIDTKLKTKQEKVVMPTYSVLNEDVYDIPLKTQVELDILVSGEISETGLRALLNKLYTSTKMKKGFKYHTSPTNIYIYAFTSKERFESGMGQWIAMLQQSPGDAKPRIDIKKRQIDQIGAKPEKRFGLSEIQRIDIWKESVVVEDKVWQEAEKRYPLDNFGPADLSNKLFQEQARKMAEFRERLERRYKNEIAKKYGLTNKQLEEIINEGVTKDWALPK